MNGELFLTVVGRAAQRQGVSRTKSVVQIANDRSKALVAGNRAWFRDRADRRHPDLDRACGDRN